MSEIPGETRPGDERSSPDAQEEMKGWLEWAQHAAVTGKDFAALAWMEIRLAMSDTGRMVVLGLVMIPLAMLAWIGLSVLIAWAVYVPTESVALGLVGFMAVQVIPMAIMGLMIKKYSKSLALPATKRHIQAFKEGLGDGAQRSD